MSGRTFPRDVVISPSFGAGIATWADLPEARRYDFVEDPEVVSCAAENVTKDELLSRVLATGRWTGEELDEIYLGGWKDATVVVVAGPYMIEEYDGFESISLQDTTEWRV